MVTCNLKRPPQAERAEGLRHTLILCISQKLERLDISDLKELHLVTNQLIQRKKQNKNNFQGKANA